MKQLQNNFTTPEQSKRLLELGVPADSADVPMIVFRDGTYIYKEVLKDKTLSDYQREDDAFQDEQDYPSHVRYCPSWSVGRLMEIFDICCVTEDVSKEGWCSYRRLHRGQTYMDYLMFVFTTNKMKDSLDFSKLEV